MSEVADLVNQLESLAGNLKAKSASTKVTDIPQEASKKLEAIILELQRVQGDIGGQTTAYVQAFDTLLSDSVANFVNLSSQLGDEIKNHANQLKQAFDAQRAFLVIASESKTPDPGVLSQLLAPTSQIIAAIQEVQSKNRSSPYFNHFSAVSDAVPALGWVTISPKPAPFVKEMGEAGQFYSNRVIKDFKEKDPRHVEWTKALMKIFKDLHDYVLKFHTTGLLWNKDGKDAKPSAAPSGPPAPPAGGPPPPPPPPAVEDLVDKPSEGGQAAARSALFDEINKGGDVTKGLKKVTPDMQTHKNPGLRQGPKPFSGPTPFKAAPVSKPTPAAAPAAKAKKPPRKELKNKKWEVEYFENEQLISIDETNMKQTVYIYKCSNSTIQIKGKVNAIILDGCKKVGLLVDSVVSAVDVINSQSVKIQVTEQAPIVNIDKTDGAMVYLSATSLTTEFVTAKSSEMNILVPDANGEFKEYAVPEQFRTVYKDGKLNTECAEVVG